MKPMNHQHNFKVLTVRQSEQRRRELETCILHLIDQDNGPQDQDPHPCDFNLEQRSLSNEGFETMQRLRGRAEGGMLSGKVHFVRSQEVPFDNGPKERWQIAYAADKITCERWRGERGAADHYHSLEVISRKPEVDSYHLEWKLSG